VQFPLSNDEHAAIARYLSGIKKQLQDVSDLFTTRYGKGSEISEESVKTLASIARLERKLVRLNEEQQQREELAVANER
jgi:cob(I)alamin adenosyltransferase